MVDPITGVWWTTANPGRRLPGTVTRSDSQWQLQVIGTLAGNSQFHEHGLSLIPAETIYGLAQSAEYTLYNCYFIDSKGPWFSSEEPSSDDNEVDPDRSERWSAELLLSGRAISRSTLLRAARFELTGLAAIWPFSGLQKLDPSSSWDEYKRPEPTVIDCSDGLVITFSANTGGTYGRRNRSIHERVSILAVSETGFTFDDFLNQILGPLRALCAIILHRHIEYFSLHLALKEDPQLEERDFLAGRFPIEVDPEVVDANVESSEYGHFPTFTAQEVRLANLIPDWLKSANARAVPIAIAQTYDQATSLQSQVVEMVNAAETLHRTIYVDTPDLPFTKKVKEALKNAGGLNSKERSKVQNAVKVMETSLEKRLAELASGLGENLCAWLFGHQVGDWARVAATVRNALSHGYPTKHEVERDVGALVGVVRLTQAVIQLRLLVEAGLPLDNAMVLKITQNRAYSFLFNQQVADWVDLVRKMEIS